MGKIKLVLAASLIMLVALSGLVAPTAYAKKLFIGGTMALTGAYAEDTAAVLAGYEDYAKYVRHNEWERRISSRHPRR